MDEQNILVSENVCEPLCPKLETSKISSENSAKREEASSGLPLSAVQAAHLLSVDSEQRSEDTARIPGTEPRTYISAENHQFAGGRVKQQHVGILLSDRNRLGESHSDEASIRGGLKADAGKQGTLGDLHTQMHAKTALDSDVECVLSQHITSVHENAAPLQNSAPVNEGFKGNGASEMKQSANSHASQQVNDVQQPGGTDIVHEPVKFRMEKANQGKASLEMLSVALESIENMQRESEEALGGAGKVVQSMATGKEILEHDIGHDAFNTKCHSTLANCITLKSSEKKSMGDSEDYISFFSDSKIALGEEFQNKDQFLNMLCELAAVQQQDREISVKHSDPLISCAASLAKNDASGDTKRLSFVDLLRKQMAQAGKVTELSADAFYEQFLRQNHAILVNTLGRDFNPSLLPAGISSNDGSVVALGAEEMSNSNSDREGDNPSNEEITGDVIIGEVQDETVDLLVKGGHSTEDDRKEGPKGVEGKFGVGDLVWAKVKSHPWWPGQIFNASDASMAAKRIRKPGRSLVAFFGDGTFGWLQESQLIAFRPNFEEKVKQTTMKSFCRAVEEALNEVSKRTELGLRCFHSSDAMYSANVFPDLNAGIRKGVRIRGHRDIKTRAEGFEPNRILEFIQTAACSPLYALSAGLEYSELCGNVYGFRNFMLSPKKPKIKIALQDVLRVQNKLNPAQSSLKRRSGLGEAGDLPSTVEGKEAKRLHLSKDVTKKEQQAGNKVQSPKFRTIENLSVKEADETKVPVQSPEHPKESTWLAKRKRLQVSPDHKEGKSVKGWHSLGPLGDLADSGAADNLTNADDDSKTLFDITGYHSLKRKKKRSHCSTDINVEQQPVEAKKGLVCNVSTSKLEKDLEEEGIFPDSSASSLSTLVPDQNLSVLPIKREIDGTEDCDMSKDEVPEVKIYFTEETEKDNTELLDLKVGVADMSEKDKGDSKVCDGEGIVEDKGDSKVDNGEGRGEGNLELQNFRDNEAQEHEKDKGEGPDLKVGDTKENEKDDGKLLDAKKSEPLLQELDKSLKRKKMQTKHLHSHSQEHEKDNGGLPGLKVDVKECAKESESLPQDVNVHDKILKRKKQTKCLQSHHGEDKRELLDLKIGDAKESEKDKEMTMGFKEFEPFLQDANDHDNILKRKKKQTECLHSEEGDLLSHLVKAKKRRQDTCQDEEKKPSSLPESEHAGSKQCVKGAKLGANIKKVADTLKGTTASLKLANNLSAKKAASAVSIGSGIKKHPKSPSLNESPVPKNLADENLNSSLAKLLNNLQAVARDPLSSANMKGSLQGVMSTFLKFRSMVFVKSSGYGTAGAGKSMSSHGNGHFTGAKKTEDKSKQNLSLKREKSHVTYSSEERKSVVKAELPSENLEPKIQSHSVQDSVSESKGKKPHSPSIDFGSRNSDLQVASIDSERASSEVPICPKNLIGGNQKLDFGSQNSDLQVASIDSERASGEVPICPKNLIGGNQKLGVQELAVAARKKKSEVLKECAAKVQAKNDVLGVQNSFKEKDDKEKFTEARHRAKSVKHHISRAETLSLPERKSIIYSSAVNKVARNLLGLYMRFPEDFTLPSEAQLKEIFNPFGILEPGGVRVNRNVSTAQVVFKHRTDAEAALQHARKNRMFGHVDVSYRLRHFSLSSKSDSKYFETTVKDGMAAESSDVKSPPVDNHAKPDHSRSSSASGAEQGGFKDASGRISPSSRVEPMDYSVLACSPVRSTPLGNAEPVHSPARSTSWTEPGSMILPEPSSAAILLHEPAVSIVPTPVGNWSSRAEQGASMLPVLPSVFQSQEALSSLSTDVPLHSDVFNAPSVSNVNVSCEDIGDEMLKLLQQVSAIVSSSTLTSRIT